MRRDLRIGLWSAAGLAGTAALGLVALNAWVFGRLAHPRGPVAVPDGVPSLSASSCAPCHPAVAADWATTRMAAARTNPVFVADWEAQGQPFVCRACHAPLHEQQPTEVEGLWWIRPLVPRESPNPAFSPALEQEGVTCVVCHLRDGALVGTRGAASVHPTRRDEGLRDPARCEGCHQVPAPPLTGLARPIADTHREWEDWKVRTGRTETCVDCHMPGGRHRWRGAWDVDTLRAGLGVDARVRDGVVEVTLENRAGHRFPSGDPARALLLRVGTEERALGRRVPIPVYQERGDDTLLPAERRTIAIPWDGRSALEVGFAPTHFLPAAGTPVELALYTVPLP